MLIAVPVAAMIGALIAAARVNPGGAANGRATARATSRVTRSKPATRPAWPDAKLVAECTRKLQELRRDTQGSLHERLDVPFVVAGDLPDDELDRVVQRTIRPAAEALWLQYFDARPTEPITILLFAEKRSYQQYANDLFGDKAVPHFGYYRHEDRTLVMNIGTGTGTLVHEMVHALAAFDFPKMPDWFSEGLASLCEQCTLAGGDIRGLVNWRLPALQKAIRDGTLRPLKELVTADDFRGPLEGLNYAQARYFCMYMQERHILRPFYGRFRAGAATDPTGLQFIREVFKGQPVDAIDRDYTRWVLTLRWD
jgi:hypothetical protein